MQSYSRVRTTKIPNCLNCIERLVVAYHLCALKAAMEFQVFNYIELLGGPSLVVCKQCQHAVWPREIGRHFCDTEHDLPKKIIRQIITTVQEREELYQYPFQLDLPIAVEHPFKSLQVRHNGLLCQFQPECCHYVCCKEESIRKHLRQAHHASQYGRKGRPTRRQQERQGTADGPVPWVPVACQRFFPSHKGSQYFQVRQPDEVRPWTADCIVSVWDQAVKTMEERVKKVEAEHQKVIVEGTD